MYCQPEESFFEFILSLGKNLAEAEVRKRIKKLYTVYSNAPHMGGLMSVYESLGAMARTDKNAHLLRLPYLLSSKDESLEVHPLIVTANSLQVTDVEQVQRSCTTLLPMICAEFPGTKSKLLKPLPPEQPLKPFYPSKHFYKKPSIENRGALKG